MKYVKVMFGTQSGADSTLEYKLNEVNVSSIWNHDATNPREMGGFNFSSEDKILRWLFRGDTIYDIDIPQDAEVVCVDKDKGIYRSNKIIISDPRIITDEYARELYKISTLPEIVYYKALAGCAIRNLEYTCKDIIRDKVNENNIDLVLSEINDFIKPSEDIPDNNKNRECLDMIIRLLNSIKLGLSISKSIDKEPYIKYVSNDKIINITGESGSGKSYYINKYRDDDNYIVLDTDNIFGSRECNKYELELKNIFLDIFKDESRDPLIYNFDKVYCTILDYMKNIDKTIIIDSALFRYISDIGLLRGKVIVMRTCVDTCFNRCVDRYKNTHKDISSEDLEKYKNKKIGMYSWYHYINEFIYKLECGSDKIA